MPDFYIETSYKQPVIGIDEVGRGPLAGPVVSCAGIFFDHFIPYLTILDHFRLFLHDFDNFGHFLRKYEKKDIRDEKLRKK